MINLKKVFQSSALLLFIAMMVACLQPPVLHKENRLSISDKNKDFVCMNLADLFPDYSCKDYLGQKYIVEEKPEQIEVFFQSNLLELRYKTEEKNESLFDRYEQLLDRLKIKQ